MKTVFVQSFGCRASQADGAAIETSLAAEGFAPANAPDQADLVVLNTCTVTASADIETRRLIRNLQRDAPQSQVLVTGCYAQRDPDALANMENVRWVVGNSHKADIAEIIRGEDYHGRVFAGDISEQREFRAAPVHGTREDRTRPNLKVQDGCGNRCAFCIIPSVRGRSRSASLLSVLEQANDLASRYAEVVLTGINLGRWGRDLPGNLRFVDLVRAILEDTPLRRLRISSVEPMDWSDDLIRLMAESPRIARHVHMPLQSASDAVLKGMRRKYRVRHYEARLEAAYDSMPDAAIGADVLTGFPGETDADFRQTVDFIAAHPFSYLHVFTYSERPGTEAAAASGVVPMHVRRERTRVLRELSERKNLAFRKSLIGRTVSAVTLEQRAMALTTNFVKVEMAGAPPPNQMLDVNLAAVTATGMREHNLLHVLQ